MARRRTPLLAALILCLLLTACAGTNANQPVRTGSEQGYPEVGKRLTQIPPDQRTGTQHHGQTVRQEPDLGRGARIGACHAGTA